MVSEYIFSIAEDFPNGKVSGSALVTDIFNSDIAIAIDHILTDPDNCYVYFKASLSSAEMATLSGVVAAHQGDPYIIKAPTMSDGRPIVRADSRPIGYATMFTMAGDTASGIGDGKEILWDFSNNDDEVSAPSGYKRKRIEINFLDPIYIKEGTVYFHSAKKGSYVDFSVICPNGQYYKKRDGSLAQATEDTLITKYLNKHHFYGNCPMGDELNTESATETALPSNYKLWIETTVPDSDNDSYGYGELEIYRERTCLLPGEEA